MPNILNAHQKLFPEPLLLLKGNFYRYSSGSRVGSSAGTETSGDALAMDPGRAQPALLREVLLLLLPGPWADSNLTLSSKRKRKARRVSLPLA